jgi:transposase-like protein
LVQRYSPELAFRQRAQLKPRNKSWRVDETYVRVKGEWCYLYRAVDSEGATIEFFLSAFRDKESAQSLFRRAIRHGAPAPRVINTDLAPIYPTAIAGLSARATCRSVAGTDPFSTSKTSWSKITAL